MNPDRNDSRLDRQIENLSASLRENGAVPERDLWPDIEAAIGRVEQAAVVKRRRGRPALWRVAAVAATLALGVGLAYVGVTGDRSREAPQATRAQEMDLAYGPGSGGTGVDPASLQAMDRNLADLNAALRQDPDNRNLSRLVLLVHRSRADIMRRDARQWQR